MVRLILIGKRIYDKFSEDEMTVYAAQVSFFVILSFVPFLMLLLTAVQMIPGISKADFLEIAMDIVPADYKSLAFRVVNDLMLKSPATMISATAVTALWSAGRGMFSVARGLNRVNGRGRRHWYVFNRLICCGYTILFIAVCLMSMGLLVFGRTLQNFIQSHFPLIAPFTGYVIQLRQLWGAAILLIFFLGIYCLPQPAGCCFLLHFPCILILQEGKTILICTAALQPLLCHFCGFISVCAYCLWERNLIGSGMRYK